MAIFRLVVGILAALGLSACSEPRESLAPHIIVLIADDLGLDVAPCHNDAGPMAFLEARCESSLVFERAYTHPYCTASRATLLTGRHPLRHGADDVSMSAVKLPLSERTIAEMIEEHSDQAYETAIFGKWHLADDLNGSERNPNLQGFDHFEGTPRQDQTYQYFEYDWYVNGELSSRVQEYRTTHISNRVQDYFRKRADDRPQFAIVSYTSPHKPYHTPPTHLHSLGDLPPSNIQATRSEQPGPNEYRVNRREPRFDQYYRAMLMALDHEMDRLITSLESESDRPIVFLFLGDNGSAAEVFAAADGTQVRSKATLYDGGVRVPLMIWSSQPEIFPIEPGRSEQLIHFADLFPTLSELAGVSPDSMKLESAPIDGSSFMAALSTQPSEGAYERDFVFLERGNDERLPFAYGAVNGSGLKLILREAQRQTNYSPGILIEIYDTEADPLEDNNLVDQLCDMPDETVSSLLDYIIGMTENTTAHSDWFNPDLYKSELARHQADCPS